MQRVLSLFYKARPFSTIVGVQRIMYSRPIIAQDKLFHGQNAVRNFLIPST